MKGKVVINLATGMEDTERVMIAFLVGGAALDRGKEVVAFLTKEAVRLAVPGVGVGTPCDGCPAIETLLQQFAEKGGKLFVCPICLNSRKLDGVLVANATIAGATPLWEWIGDEPATTFDY